MEPAIKELDWKLFSRLRETALDTSRSRAPFQLAHIYRLGLLTDEEMSRFGSETRQIIHGWLGIDSSQE